MEPIPDKQTIEFGMDEDFEETKQLFAQTSKENFFSDNKIDQKFQGTSYSRGFRSTGTKNKMKNFMTPDLGLQAHKIVPLSRDDKIALSRGNTMSRGEVRLTLYFFIILMRYK